MILGNVNYFKKVVFPLEIRPVVVLGSLGFWPILRVLLRDIGQIVEVLTMALMYITPIFYPVSVLPVEYQSWMSLNPVINSIEQVRNVMMWGRGPDWSFWILEMMLGLVLVWLGFAWLEKTPKGFADVA